MLEKLDERDRVKGRVRIAGVLEQSGVYAKASAPCGIARLR